MANSIYSGWPSVLVGTSSSIGQDDYIYVSNENPLRVELTASGHRLIHLVFCVGLSVPSTHQEMLSSPIMKGVLAS